MSAASEVGIAQSRNPCLRLAGQMSNISFLPDSDIQLESIVSFPFFVCQTKKGTKKIHRLIKIAKNQGFSLKFRSGNLTHVAISNACLNFLTAETLIFFTRFL
jgi:hypothetical protein